MRKVVVTGMGVISPLGLNVASTWTALTAGQTGLGRITRFDPAAFRCHVAGEVKGFEATLENTGLDAKALKRMDRFSHMGLAAAWEAMGQAGLRGMKDWPAEAREKVAVFLSSGIGGLESLVEAQEVLAAKGPRAVSPRSMGQMLINMLAGEASIQYGALGANYSVVSACASSTHALGLAKMQIESGRADVVLAGGAEAAITPLGIGAFAAMRALSSSYNDTPAAASRPFDTARDGFVMGEGAAVLVLESEEHAKARGATILATLAGYGETSDASDPTSPSGEGAVRAMKQALRDAGLQAADVGYINAHATSTPAGDEVESNGIKSVFGTTVPVSGTKGATGHLLGAAGALEAVFAVQALITQTLPPTLNLATPCDGEMDYIPLKARKVDGVKAVLSNSFGFGGTNGSLVVTRG
ncbi:MAG: beta-ketoacyl-ACP synthase II [Alphaproteobacteria bacterium]